jgi:hypothetical protein
MKILSIKRYNELLDIEEKYKFLNGKMFTYAVGGRSRRARLLQLQKEELVRIIFELIEDITKLRKSLESKGE